VKKECGCVVGCSERVTKWSSSKEVRKDNVKLLTGEDNETGSLPVTSPRTFPGEGRRYLHPRRAADFEKEKPGLKSGIRSGYMQGG